MSVLAAQGLDVGTGGLKVLDGLDLDVAPGQVLGVVGESGAGKSMIGRAIADLLPPGFAVTAGSLAFDGRDLLALSRAARRALLGREIAFVPQEPLSALDPVMTIGAQFGEHLGRLGIADRRRAAVAALQAVHLSDPAALLRRYPHQLSGGMCQRVLIAMAFAGRPKLVVADEPTTALDVTVQARIVALMRELQRAHGTAVLFITHDLRLAGQVCDDVVVLYAGAVAERGQVRRVFAAPTHPYTRCLQLANPAMHGPARALFVLPGQMPSLRDIASLPGCRFAPRCPAAVERCTQAPPPLARVGEAQHAACIRPQATPHIRLASAVEEQELAAPGPPLLTLEGVRRVFRAGRPWRRRDTVAVQGASFTLAAGEFVAVVGESGSGKSTLGRMIVGLERPTSGRIALAGRDVTRPDAAARAHRLAHVQMIFQDPNSALNPRRRIGGIVTQRMEALHRRRAERESRAVHLLRDLGLSPSLAPRLPAQLSGGQRQRVNIGRAVCEVPSLLVADEIVSGLDVSVQAQLLALLRQLRHEHRIALLFITHDLAVVRALCDRVLVMREGAIVEQGTVADVFARPAHPYTRALLAAVPPEIEAAYAEPAT
ncbi:MAG: ABC transporter ATP-binding protein [Acetobacteraceae bacterium]|nr:ABC transporter ATP-binding protein [Acetobacteraceae bacterium]